MDNKLGWMTKKIGVFYPVKVFRNLVWWFFGFFGGKKNLLGMMGGKFLLYLWI